MSTVGDDSANEAADDINMHRRHIDRIDQTIVALLAERMRLGWALGAIKRQRAWPTRVAAREAEVLARVRNAAGGPLSPASAERIFTAIIAETTAVQDGQDD